MALDEPSSWAIQDAEATSTLNAYEAAVNHVLHGRHSARRLLQSEIRRLRTDSLNVTEIEDWVEDGHRPFNFLYKREGGGDILTPQCLRDICRFERITFQSPFYISKCTRYHQRSRGACPSNLNSSEWLDCRQDGNFSVQSECTPLSLITLFYGNLSAFDWTCSLLDATFVEARKQIIMQDLQAHGARSQYSAFVGSGVVQDGFTNVLRSMIQLLGGCEGDFGECSGNEHFKKLEESIFNAFDPPLSYGFDIFPHFGIHSAYELDADQFINFGAVRVRFWLHYVHEGNRVIMQDFSLAFLSCIFVWIWMWTHMGCCRSDYPGFMLASLSMLQILCTLPLSALFYRHVFMIDYFEYVHVLIVYLVLGVGADDVFVVVDTWKEAAKLFPPDDCNGGYCEPYMLRKRLAHTLRVSAAAILNTSFTTTMAFVSCSISKVMPMRTLGWYASICVLANYILVMTLTPSLLIIGFQRFECRRSPTRCCLPRCGLQIRQGQIMPESKNGVQKAQTGCTKYFFCRIYLPLMRKRLGSSNWLKPFALLCVVSLLICGIQGFVFAMQLTPPMEQERWFPSNHVLTNLEKYLTDTFLSADEDYYVTVKLFWGISGINRDGVNTYRPDEFKGTPVFANDFDVSTEGCQREILDTCTAFRVLPCNLKGCSNAGLGTLVRPGENACFIEDFNTWLQQHRNYSLSALPLTGNTFLSELRAFQRAFQVPQASEKLADYSEMIGIPRASRCNSDNISNISDACPGVSSMPRFAAVAFRTTMPWSADHSSGTPVQDLVEAFVKARQRGACGTSLKAHAGRKFASFDIGKELISGLFSGVAIAGPVTFLVLLISTGNIVMSFYATSSVVLIVVSVLGFCKQPMGWGLGIAESISGVIVIGLSVDYVIHLAHMYCEARNHSFEDRDGKATFAVENMGSTIFAGAVTTGGAASVMFLCFFYFFTKMAILMCLTISFSLLFSLFFFVPLLFLIGPEGAFGDIPVEKYCRRCLTIVFGQSRAAQSSEEDGTVVSNTFLGRPEHF